MDDTHPNEEKIPCPACPSLFENIKNLKIHAMEHVPNNNTETNSSNGNNNTENVNADSSFDFDQIEEDSDVSLVNFTKKKILNLKKNIHI